MYAQSDVQKMWEEDLHFPGSRHENVSIIDAPDPTRPPTPPHTDSSHSSEQERALPPLALARSPAFSYSFDDVSRVKRPVFEDARQPLHAIPPSNDHAQTPILLRNLDRPPTNPHDHSLLETIYNEMHSARFINLEPVALLANMLPLHFKGPYCSHWAHMSADADRVRRRPGASSYSHHLPLAASSYG